MQKHWGFQLFLSGYPRIVPSFFCMSLSVAYARTREKSRLTTAWHGDNFARHEVMLVKCRCDRSGRLWKLFTRLDNSAKT